MSDPNQQNSLTPIYPKQSDQAAEKVKKSPSSFFVRVPLAEKILFAKHLSMMVNSGMTEVESLRLVANQITSKRFAAILGQIIKSVENGQSLSESLSAYRSLFGDLFINIIKIGEISGTLSENLEYLAQEMKKNQALRSKIRGALIYPAVILVATLVVVGGLIFFILPKILPIFRTLKVELPFTTRVLIWLTDFLQKNYLYVGLGIVALAGIWFALLKAEKFRYFIHKLILSFPVFGGMSQEYNMANMTRILAILLKSGVKIVEATSVTSNAMTNLVYKKSLREAAYEIQKGKALFTYFEERPDIFPTTVSRMIEVGEKTGNLDNNLTYLSEFYENEVDEVTKNLSSILEPILLIFMGVAVGFVALAIITPIYGITQGLKVK